MGQRSLEQRSQELQAEFEELLESRNVYYNPPASVKMKYDAIVFTRSRIENTFANNSVYAQNYCYQVTVITKDPDAAIIDKMSRRPRCSFERHFVADNLHHNIFNLYD